MEEENIVQKHKSKLEKFLNLARRENRNQIELEPFLSSDDKELQECRFRPGEVVRITTDNHWEVPKGCVGELIYYYSAETFGRGFCQVIFYDPWDQGEVGAQVNELELERPPVKEIPSWLPFTMDKDGKKGKFQKGKGG